MAGGKVCCKKNCAVKSAQIKSVFFFFFYMRQTPFCFLFLAVSRRIRCGGRGEWVREKAAKEEGKGRGWRTAWSGAAKGQSPVVMVTWCLDPSAVRAQNSPAISSPGIEARGLTQAGDVGSATWGRHDALRVPARNVVVNLSSCEQETGSWIVADILGFIFPTE